MFKIMKELGPEGFETRRPRSREGRDWTGNFIVPGPDYIWCADGHVKPHAHGIEIYAMVGGYSRYVTSVFVGLSATCGRSVGAHGGPRGCNPQ